MGPHECRRARGQPAKRGCWRAGRPTAGWRQMQTVSGAGGGHTVFWEQVYAKTGHRRASQRN